MVIFYEAYYAVTVNQTASAILYNQMGEDRMYQEVESIDELYKTVEQCLEEYNQTHKTQMNLVIFRSDTVPSLLHFITCLGTQCRPYRSLSLDSASQSVIGQPVQFYFCYFELFFPPWCKFSVIISGMCWSIWSASVVF